MSLDEARILQEAVEGCVFIPQDPQQAAAAMAQLWDMHKHGRIYEPELEDGIILVELTPLGLEKYASIIEDRTECPRCGRIEVL